VYVDVIGTNSGNLWTSDGTYAGTRPVTNLNAAGLLGAAGNSFYFTTWSQNAPYRLWVTDGTAAGTKMVRDDLTVGGPAAALGGNLVFVASAGTSSDELWVTDGTAAGTTPLKVVNPTGVSRPRNFVARGAYLYFTADDGTTGRELWRTDGTAAGTIRLADLYPGAVSSDPEFLTPATGGLYFAATTPTTGRELWVTDGTPQGTVQVADRGEGTFRNRGRRRAASGRHRRQRYRGRGRRGVGDRQSGDAEGVAGTLRVPATNETGGELPRRRPLTSMCWRLSYSNSITGCRSSRTYIGRPVPFGKVMPVSTPIAW
jgi:ELWxxDGT repeat protein